MPKPSLPEGAPRPGGRLGLGTGPAVAWIVFTVVCCQLAFSWPYVILVPGDRTNVFAGMLCLAAGLSAWGARDRAVAPGSRWELGLSGVLAALVVASGLTSPTPLTSSLRGFVLVASGLGAFWSARLLLASPGARRYFQGLGLILLSGLLLLSLTGYLLYGEVRHFFDPNRHPLPALILLLAGAPLNLLLTGSRRAKILGGLLLAGSYGVILLSQTLSAVLFPPVLGLVVGLGYRPSRRYFLAGVGVMVVVVGLLHSHLPWQRLRLESHSLYFRLENVPFSWTIASRHPWLGNGLCAPRTAHLEAYTIKYPFANLSREGYAVEVAGFRTSDNIILTFLADLGLPFVCLYLTGVVILLGRLVAAARNPAAVADLHPVSLLLPLGAGLLYFQVFDGLLFPQLNWFFHLLLGLIPASPWLPAGAPARGL